jgi:hypothetical protein
LKLCLQSASLALGLVLVGPAPGPAALKTSFDNSLWIGTDNNSGRSVLNMDRSGAVLRTVGPVECTGFAINPDSGLIYFATSGGGITSRDLGTASAGASFAAGGSEDMTFDGTFIWRTGVPGPSSSTVITKIDPVPFQTVGIAWDGSGFWIDEFTANGLVERFDPAGVPTGESFHTSGSHVNGGLAYDKTDSTLYVGTFGGVYHYSRTGTALGSFPIPADQVPGRFVDGLEFQAAPLLAGVGESPPVHITLNVWPNPSRGEVVFALEAPGVKRVRIYNLSGALIREMPIGTESGRVAMHWNGRNDAGTKMPSGEYFVRVQAGANFQVRRFSLIR